MSKLFFKPADHPKSAINHIFMVIVFWDGRGRLGCVLVLDIVWRGGADRSGGAKA